MKIDIRDLSEAEKKALLLLRQQNGMRKGDIPERGTDQLPGKRILISLQRRGLAYLAQGWIDKAQQQHPSSWELTYPGSLLAKDLAQGERVKRNAKKMGVAGKPL